MSVYIGNVNIYNVSGGNINFGNTFTISGSGTMTGGASTAGGTSMSGGTSTTGGKSTTGGTSTAGGTSALRCNSNSRVASVPGETSKSGRRSHPPSNWTRGSNSNFITRAQSNGNHTGTLKLAVDDNVLSGTARLNIPIKTSRRS